MIVFRGVKIFRSRAPVEGALLSHHTPFCWYHVELGHEPVVEVAVTVRLENRLKRRVRNAEVTFLGIRSDYGQEVIRFEANAGMRTRDEGRAVFHTAEIPVILPRRSAEISVRYWVRMKAYDAGSFRVAEDERFTRPLPLQQSDREPIKKLAEELEAEDGRESIENVVRWVRENIRYDRVYSRLGALVTLRRGSGSCIEVADLTVSILRAMGIPARVVRGYFVDEYHAWLEVKTNKGWVPVEPLAGLVGAIGVPWLSYLSEESPREREVSVRNCPRCDVRWEIRLV